MPRIVVRPIKIEPNLHMAQAFARAGETIAKGIRASGEQKAKRAAEAEKRAQDAADMAGIQEVGAAQSEEFRGQALTSMLQDAASRPGGAIGPFGALDPRRMMEGQAQALAIKQRMAKRAEMAATMSPDAARRFLQAGADEERTQAVDQGYHRDLQTLQDATTSGKIDPGVAQKLNRELQKAIKEGRPTSGIYERVAKHVELYEKSKQRAVAWQEADQQAAGTLKALEQVSAIAPSHQREEIRKKLALARAEWARTEDGPSGANPFRAKNDPQESLAVLQKLLFEGQAGSDAEAVGRTGTEANVAGAAAHRAMFDPALANPPGLPRATPEAEKRARAAAPRGQPARQGLTGEEETSQVRDVVDRGALEALQSGSMSERRAAMQKLLEQVADELGLDPTSPQVLAIVREQLSGAFQRAGAPR